MNQITAVCAPLSSASGLPTYSHTSKGYGLEVGTDLGCTYIKNIAAAAAAAAE